MHLSSVNDKVMSTREAAQALGAALRTVQFWVEGGALPAWKTAGGHRRIFRSAVTRLVQQRRGAVAMPGAWRLRLLVVQDDPIQWRLHTRTLEHVC